MCVYREGMRDRKIIDNECRTLPRKLHIDSYIRTWYIQSYTFTNFVPEVLGRQWFEEEIKHKSKLE